MDMDDLVPAAREDRDGWQPEAGRSGRRARIGAFCRELWRFFPVFIAVMVAVVFVSALNWPLAEDGIVAFMIYASYVVLLAAAVLAQQIRAAGRPDAGKTGAAPAFSIPTPPGAASAPRSDAPPAGRGPTVAGTPPRPPADRPASADRRVVCLSSWKRHNAAGARERRLSKLRGG